MDEFLYILKCYVQNDIPELGCDLLPVFQQAKRHNLLPLVLEVCIDAGLDSNNPVYQPYLNDILALTINQVQKSEEFLRVYRVFSEYGYHPLVLKGIICRQLYGKYRDSRISGDEDILVKKDEYEAIRDILLSEGYVEDIDAVDDGLKEKLQEVTFFSKYFPLHIEVHLNLNGDSNKLRRKMNSYFGHVFENGRIVNVEGGELHTLSHTDHHLFLIIHAFRHFTGGGFGIRQVLDIMMYGREYANEIDWGYVWKILRELKADIFYSDIIHLGNQYLGFSQQIDKEPRFVDDLLQDLMESGIFGMDTQERHTAALMTSAAVSGGKGYWIRTLFPSKADMLNIHPELEEKPWLIMKLWVKRWIRFGRKNKSADGNLIKNGVKISQKRIMLLKKYGII